MILAIRNTIPPRSSKSWRNQNEEILPITAANTDKPKCLYSTTKGYTSIAEQNKLLLGGSGVNQPVYYTSKPQKSYMTTPSQTH